MTSRERTLCAMDGGQPDRVPLDIWATGEVWEQLRAHFGGVGHAAVRERLHIDGHHGVGLPYIGPPPEPAPEGLSRNYWGMVHRVVDYGAGTYAEQVHWPLAEARSPADIEAWPWPHPDWFDYQAARRACEAAAGRHVVECGYFAPFYFYNLLRGLEQSCLDLAADPEIAHAVVDRLGNFFYAQAERLFDACRGLVDVTQLTDDFGGQTGLLISPRHFDEYFLPHYRRLAALMRDHGIRIFHHDDGAMWELIPRLVDLGVRVLNPVQYRCGAVSRRWLKETYGERICFHGGVDNQQVLPFGTADEVRAEVRACLAELGEGGGYILAPCHNLQPITPIENIVAMYETAWDEGWYD